MARYKENLRSCLARLKPYVAGRGIQEIAAKYGLPPDGIVKLGSNENPYGPSPKVYEAIASARPERYPEPGRLVEALAGYAGAPPEDVVIGAGMDGVMDTLTRLSSTPSIERCSIPPPSDSTRVPLCMTERSSSSGLQILL